MAAYFTAIITIQNWGYSARSIFKSCLYLISIRFDLIRFNVYKNYVNKRSVNQIYIIYIYIIHWFHKREKVNLILTNAGYMLYTATKVFYHKFSNLPRIVASSEKHKPKDFIIMQNYIRRGVFIRHYHTNENINLDDQHKNVSTIKTSE